MSGRHHKTRSQINLSELGLRVLPHSPNAAHARYHYKARIYSPYLGRFLQTDPIGYEDGMNGQLNAPPNPEIY